MIRLVCEKCSKAVPGYEDELGLRLCCDVLMVRRAAPPTTVVKEVIDTGHMVRRVEAFANMKVLQEEKRSTSIVK